MSSLTETNSSTTTQRVPLGARYFHPAGFGASVTATYWRQDGQFGGFPNYRHGTDNFWLIDAALSYRLPKRYGFVIIGVTNLFDEDFRFFDLDPYNSTIQAGRMAFARVSISFP